MLNIFGRLTAVEEMPEHEKIQVQRRRLYSRPGWSQAMLLLWVAISAGLLTVALILNANSHEACIRSMGMACPSPASHSMPTGLIP